MPGLFEELSWRGLVHQLTHPDELRLRLDKPGMTLYTGFDPTADSLHVGHMFQLLNLARFQRAGHRPIALVGGGTGFIGDPSGKSEERKLLTREKLEENVAGIRRQVATLIDLSSDDRGLLLDNSAWLCEFSLIDFLRDVGKHFSINMMLEKDSVRSRLESASGISYTEFSYMLLQSYDFLHLYDRYGCALQVGGSDQWGNITAGMDLIRRTRAGEAFGLTTPLITKADGTKFGKTEKGAVWLDARYTSPYQFYQFFVRTDDRDVGKYLRYFTFLSQEEVAALEAAVASRPEAREAQKRLAAEITTMVHGAGEAKRAENAAQVLFGGSLESLDERTLLDVFADAPSMVKGRIDLEGAGAPLVDLLVETGLSQSKGMARKDLAGGGVYLNNERVADRNLTTADLVLGRYLVLRKGKKNYHLVRVD
jgi:tyrosyl-tRNA synthetase